ncbi:mCG1026701 [Mus musculus]|nr:mCG1026701 [Mus musculus]
MCHIQQGSGDGPNGQTHRHTDTQTQEHWRQKSWEWPRRLDQNGRVAARTSVKADPTVTVCFYSTAPLTNCYGCSGV